MTSAQNLRRRLPVAIVTGSTRGIGLATAARFLAGGTSVVISGRQAEASAAALVSLADLSTGGAQVAAIVGDVSEPTVASELVTAAGNLGDLAIVVANVGGGTVGRTWRDLDQDSLAESYRQNVLSVTEVIKAAIPSLLQNPPGRIITVSSLAGRRYGRVSGIDYSAHKAAVVGLTRALAAELAEHGITVNCVAPGLIATDRARSMVDSLRSGADERIRAGTPLGRWGTPDEVAAAIAFLASPDASYITGHTLDVNGGAYMN